MKILVTMIFLISSTQALSSTSWTNSNLSISDLISKGYEVIDVRERRLQKLGDYNIYYTLINKENGSTYICLVQFELEPSTYPLFTACYEEK